MADESEPPPPSVPNLLDSVGAIDADLNLDDQSSNDAARLDDLNSDNLSGTSVEASTEKDLLIAYAEIGLGATSPQVVELEAELDKLGVHDPYKADF